MPAYDNPFGAFGTQQLAAWTLRLVEDPMFSLRMQADPHLFAMIYAACATSVEPPASLTPEGMLNLGELDGDGEATERIMKILKDLNRQFGGDTSGEFARLYLQGVHAYPKCHQPDFAKHIAEWRASAEHVADGALTSLEQNLDRLKELLEMTDLERDILLLQIERYSPGFAHVFNSLLGGDSMPAVMAVMLGADSPEAITDILTDESNVLIRSGLLRVQEYPLRVGVPSPHLRSVLVDVAEEMPELMERFVSELEPKSTTGSMARLDDRDAKILDALLALDVPEDGGLNVLLYGPKAIDKRDMLARVLPEMGRTPYVVGSKNVPGSDMPAWTFIAQRWLEEQDEGAVLVIERAEQALAMREMPSMGEALFGLMDPADQAPTQEERASDRGLLSSGIRCIWISEKPQFLSEQNLGKFIFHCEVRPGSRADRRARVKDVVKEFELSPEVEHQLSKYSLLGEQSIRQAATLTELLTEASVPGISDDQESRERTLLRAVHQSQRILGREQTEDLRESVTAYSLENLNLSGRFTPEQIVAALKKRPKGTIALYGLPGAGKTQLMEFLAVELDMPLLSKRASDLLSKWVGESEGNIAAMFAEAEAEGAILGLDECDSFMRDRAHARAEWSVSQTNEILQHMERFDGIFIAATNLFQDIDAAALRRFTFKLEFKALRPEQAWSMFCKESGFDENADPKLTEELKGRLETIPDLAPGDFATVKRQTIILDEELDPEEWIVQLAEEAKAKMAGLKSHGVGFAAHD